MNKTPFYSIAATIAAVFLFASYAGAQDYAGIRTSDYFGINGVFYNPAGIVATPYRFDINLGSFSVSAGNNKVDYQLKNHGNILNSDSIEKIAFGENAGTASGAINADFHGPSFLFNASSKTAFALSTRIRYMVNITDLDGKLFGHVSGESDNNADLPYTISSAHDMRVKANAWSEVGASMAHIFMNGNGNLLKAGITLKYMMGTSGTYIRLNRFNGTLNTTPGDPQQKVFLEKASGQINIGSAGINLGDIQLDQLFDAKGSGIGADIGFIYEYRPQAASYDSSHFQFKQSPYKIRVSFALLDLGGLTYHTGAESGAYDIDIAGDEKLDLGQMQDLTLKKYKAFFDQHPQYFTPAKNNTTSSYKMALPTSLLASIDYRLAKRLYFNLESRIGLMGNNSGPANNYYSSFTLTPRFEGRSFGVFLPVNYNKLTQLNAGFALRAGPLFVGSGSILTAMLSKSKQADVFLGIHITSLRRNNR